MARRPCPPCDCEALCVPAGLERVEDVWQYQEWEDVRLVTSWNPPHVEAVRGTDAFQFRSGRG